MVAQHNAYLHVMPQNCIFNDAYDGRFLCYVYFTIILKTGNV